jgi:hypothetical protein
MFLLNTSSVTLSFHNYKIYRITRYPISQDKDPAVLAIWTIHSENEHMKSSDSRRCFRLFLHVNEPSVVERLACERSASEGSVAKTHLQCSPSCFEGDISSS